MESEETGRSLELKKESEEKKVEKWAHKTNSLQLLDEEDIFASFVSVSEYRWWTAKPSIFLQFPPPIS